MNFRNYNNDDKEVLIWLSVLALAVALVVTCLTGYAFNIADLAKMGFEEMRPLLFLRAIGIFFPPLGAFLGLFVDN